MEENARKDVELLFPVVCYQQMLTQHELIAYKSSDVVSEELMLFDQAIYEFTLESISEKVFVMEKELIMSDEQNYIDDFKVVEGNDSSEDYKAEEKIEWTEDFITIDYKIKDLNISRAHPIWSLQNFQKKECCRLKYTEIWWDGRNKLKVMEVFQINLESSIRGRTVALYKL